MGSFKAPRDKLVCLLNCCRVINNLLINAHLREGEGASPGADDFLPVLVYVLLKVTSGSFLGPIRGGDEKHGMPWESSFWDSVLTLFRGAGQPPPPTCQRGVH